MLHNPWCCCHMHSMKGIKRLVTKNIYIFLKFALSIASVKKNDWDYVTLKFALLKQKKENNCIDLTYSCSSPRFLFTSSLNKRVKKKKSWFDEQMNLSDQCVLYLYSTYFALQIYFLTKVKNYLNYISNTNDKLHYTNYLANKQQTCKWGVLRDSISYIISNLRKIYN